MNPPVVQLTARSAPRVVRAPTTSCTTGEPALRSGRIRLHWTTDVRPRSVDVDDVGPHVASSPGHNHRMPPGLTEQVGGEHIELVGHEAVLSETFATADVDPILPTLARLVFGNAIIRHVRPPIAFC